jgi:hypothetical protein
MSDMDFSPQRSSYVGDARRFPASALRLVTHCSLLIAFAKSKTQSLRAGRKSKIRLTTRQ